MSKRSSKKTKRRGKTLPALGFAGVSLSMASGACASTAEASANTPPTLQTQSRQIFLGEEEISDVSLATFHVYDRENVRSSAPGERLRLARCGGCGCGHGCGGGGCHAGCAGGGSFHVGCAGGGCHVGCAVGGCHVGCAGGFHGGCRCGGLFIGACVGCAGCGGCAGTCWAWVPTFGWVYSCWSGSPPAGETSAVVGLEQSAPTTEAVATVVSTIADTRTK
jgi:hypothetical protein